MQHTHSIKWKQQICKNKLPETKKNSYLLFATDIVFFYHHLVPIYQFTIPKEHRPKMYTLEVCKYTNRYLVTEIYTT